jgi:hypothetical protein
LNVSNRWLCDSKSDFDLLNQSKPFVAIKQQINSLISRLEALIANEAVFLTTSRDQEMPGTD